MTKITAETIEKLKQISSIYKKASPMQRNRIIDLSQNFIQELIHEGYYEDFITSVALFGTDYLSLSTMKNNPFYKNKFPEIYEAFL